MGEEEALLFPPTLALGEEEEATEAEKVEAFWKPLRLWSFPWV